MRGQALHLVQPTARASTTHDGLLHLARNLNPHPDTLIGDGNGILVTGIPGSGKTTILALLLEQFGLCKNPFAAFDWEGDLRSVVPFLPRGVLATATNCPTVQDMYGLGLQVIFDLETFGRERAAILISSIVNGLMAHVKGLPHHQRVPFLIGLDEAAYWLPQRRSGNDHLSVDQFKDLFNAFHSLAIRGRKMGLVPLLCTQRFADVHKDVLSPGTYIIMRQTLDTDLKRCMEYISASAFGEEDDEMTQIQMRKRIATFKKGQAVIKLPSGKQGLVQFYNRQSPHISHAPKSEAVTSLYRDVPFDPNRQYGAANLEGEEAHPLDTQSKRLGKPKDQEAETREHPYRDQIFALLDADPDRSPESLAKDLKCRLRVAQHYRTTYFTRYPEKKSEPAPTMKDQVFALLDTDPTQTSHDLAARTKYPLNTMNSYLREYFFLHPEKKPEKRPGKMELSIRALLAENPDLSVGQIKYRTGYPGGEIRRLIARIQKDASEGGQQ